MKKRDDLYLLEIESRILRIASHLKGVTQSKFLQSDLHRSAVARELEVIGEAANKVSPEVRAKFTQIPWQQIIGMRNRLIHGYFDVDYSIVWETSKTDLPRLLDPVRKAILETAPPLHRWRVCPAGYYRVRKHGRTVDPSDKNPDGETSVRSHCRRNPSGKDQLYPHEMSEILETARPHLDSLGPVGKLQNILYANDFDSEIQVWTKYWNDVLSPSTQLDPNLVKALLGSESTFNLKVKDVRVSKGNFARGLFQITDQTRKILTDEKGELKEHFVTLSAREVKNPAFAAAAAIRWLFRKRELASSYLGREATWEEAVSEYKGYLRSKKSAREPRGMKVFNDFLQKIRQGG